MDIHKAFANTVKYLASDPQGMGFMPILSGLKVVRNDSIPIAGVSTETSTLLLSPRFASLPLKVRAEVLKHELYHVMVQSSKHYDELVKRYGPVLANMASDIYINQMLDVDLLNQVEGGVMTCEKFGLPKGLTIEEYCRKLKEGGYDKQPKCPADETG